MIDFFGEIYVDNTDLIITRLEFTMAQETQDGLNSRTKDAAWARALGLNARSVHGSRPSKGVGSNRVSVPDPEPPDLIPKGPDPSDPI